jgi:glycine cleavage system H protein
MARVGKYELPDELYYHKEYLWVRVEGDVAVCGLIDHYQDVAGNIAFVDLPMVGEMVTKDERIGTFETGKWVGKIFAPVSGEIIETNEELADDPSLINKDPYGAGWMFKIRMENPDELKELYHGASAVAWQEELLKKYPPKEG